MKLYTVKWIEVLLEQYQKGGEKFFIDGKEVRFKKEEFLYALIHIYKRTLLERWGKDIDYHKIEELKTRLGFDFMYLVDLMRKELATWFKELVIYRNFSEEEYLNLAKEFLILEEQVKKQIQIPLLDEVKKIANKLEQENFSELSLREKNKFFRILSLFVIIEAFEKTLSSKLVDRAAELSKKKLEKDVKEEVIKQVLPKIKDLKEFEEVIKGEVIRIKTQIKSMER
ncbi:MAG: hypothetical protein GXO57_00440 [Thermodesulfobacteria bacterium]|nr:hypothetical protein [Thermodesulfobacteriota bacterium]